MSTPACPCCTEGGNSVLSNGNEAVNLQAVTNVPVEAVGDYREDDSYVQGVFREPDIAGS